MLEISDQKGGIESSDFLRFWQKLKDSSPHDENTDGYEDESEILETFKKYDTNGDGYITKDEMMAVMSKMTFVANKDEEVEKCLKDLDADGDGRISYAEFLIKLKMTWNLSFFQENFFLQFAFKKRFYWCIKVRIRIKNDFENWQFTTMKLLLRTTNHS